MNVMKFFTAIFMFVVSTSVNAVIVDVDYAGWVGLEDSDEGVWSKDLWQSEVTGKFWYDTELAPKPTVFYPNTPNTYYSYESETNSWLNMVFFIDGKTIDISGSAQGYAGPEKNAEGLMIGADPDYFRIYDKVMQGDLSGDYVYKSADFRTTSVGVDLIKHNGLEQNFSRDENACCSDFYLSLQGSSNGKKYRSYMELAITKFTVTTREASVPEPSSFSLLFLGLIGLVFRHRAQQK